MSPRLAWLLWIVAAPAFAQGIEAAWQPAKTVDGVEVFTGQVTGSRFLAFRAVTHIDAAIEKVFAAILDHAAYPEWYDSCKGVELIELDEDGTGLIRVTIKTPFPLADRDAVNRVTLESRGRSVLIRLTSEPDRVDAVRGLVRMRQASGSWLLEPAGEGTRVTHTYHAEPRARLPAWMVNRFIVDGPIKTLSNLRRRVE